MTDIDMGIRFCLAALLGAVIGFEREFSGKAAGFRTHSLVSAGSCLFMLVSIHMFEMYKGQVQADPARIAAQVVSGIGFIGAGAIIRSGASVKGITTAATLWVVSGIGLACGTGFYSCAIYATLSVLVILLIFAQLERKFLKKNNNNKEGKEGEL